MRKISTLSKSSEKGQYIALFLIFFIVLVGFAALAIDVGRLLVEQRRVQNAADNAALAAVSAYCQNLPDYQAVGFSVANENLYIGDGTTHTVTINVPPSFGVSAGKLSHLEVIVNSIMPTTLAKIFNINSFSASARAVGHCQGGGGYAIFAGADDCGSGGKTIDWSGSKVTVEGNVHSNDNLYVGGQSNWVNGTATIVELAQPPSYYPSSSITFNPPSPNPVQSSSKPYPVVYNYDDFAPGGSEAMYAGSHYYSCNCKMDLGWLQSHGLYNSTTQVLNDGVYFTTGDVDLSAGSLVGNRVTFVAGGVINISGSDQFLRPYTSGLLAYSYNYSTTNQCTTPLVKFAGGSNDWGGIIFVPHGLIEMSGSSTSSYDGGLIGWSIRINGSDLNISYNPAYFSPVISLTE